MLFDKGVAKSVSLGSLPRRLTLDNPAGWTTGDDVSLSTDKAMKISTVNRCVEVLSNSVAILPVYIMNESTKERLGDHHLGRVLWGRPNEAMTSFDYEKLMGVNKRFRGNAYAWINRSPSTGHPVELIPLAPDYVTPKIDRDGHLWYYFIHPVTGEITCLDRADVLHYKEYSEDGIEGISVLRRAALSIQTALAAQQYENDVYRNGGRPSGVLTTDSDLGGTMEIPDVDGTMKTVFKKDFLRKDWDRVHTGPGKGFRLAVLDLGLKYQPIAMTNTDAQFVESSELRVADMCRFFGVPLHLVYAGKQSYNSNEQNSLEFVKYTIQADLTQREQEDTFKLLLPFERAQRLRVKRELKAFLRGDSVSQAAWYKAMREAGPYSVNDILALEDMPPVPGGEHRLASWNYGPLDQWALLSVIRAMGGKTGDEGGKKDG